MGWFLNLTYNGTIGMSDLFTAGRAFISDGLAQVVLLGFFLTRPLLTLQILPPALLTRSPHLTLQATGNSNTAFIPRWANLSGIQILIYLQRSQLLCLAWGQPGLRQLQRGNTPAPTQPEWWPQPFGSPCVKSTPLALAAQPWFIPAELRVYF